MQYKSQSPILSTWVEEFEHFDQPTRDIISKHIIFVKNSISLV